MPHTAKKPRPPERDYSHRALLDKLGVKPEHRVAVLDIKDMAFLSDLRDRAANVVLEKPQRDSDLIFLGVEEKKALPQLKPLQRFIQRAGGIWVIYPKGQKHIAEKDVINAGKDAGLVDNKVCSFSATHTALRFVIPVAKR